LLYSFNDHRMKVPESKNSVAPAIEILVTVLVKEIVSL
jgi:hypothetical protein